MNMQDTNDDLDLNPPILYINDEERNFMQLLAPILTRSPRSMKRFVNVYRLIKVGMNDAQWHVYYSYFSPSDNNQKWSFRNFEIVMFLLAIITGLPTISRLFFQTFRLNQGDLHSLQDVLARINIIYKEEWYIFDEPASTLPRSISISFKNENQTSNPGPNQPSGFTEQIISGQNPNIVLNNMQLEFLNFCHWLENWQDVNISRQNWLELSTTQLKYWDPYVSRYSFRIDPLPPEELS